MTLRVNIVVRSADLHWIGGRFARELVDRLPAFGVEATINGKKADLEYQQIVYGGPDTRPAVGLFTHGDFRPRKYAVDYDGHVSLNSVMNDFLREGGARNPRVIQMAVDDRYVRHTPLVFGVAGRTYADGRKGEELVRQAVAAGYKFVAWGSGWPCEIVSTELNDLPRFYGELDFYIDTSTDEGGCVPALEAAALGIPVISHTVGVDRPVIAYERGSWESLSRVLAQLTRPRSYDDWAREHAAYFMEVVGS